MQAAQAPPSRRHSNVEPGSVAAKLKLALVEAVGLGGVEVIGYWAGWCRSSRRSSPGVPSVLPAVSVARTWTVCEPAASDAYERGLVQAAAAAAVELALEG